VGASASPSRGMRAAGRYGRSSAANRTLLTQVSMHANRSTLCQVEGSMLSALFSGRWSHERDEAGRLFLDWHPKLGAKLVDWLRERRMIEDGEAMPPPDIPAELAR
jgi:hypothetical protein